MKKLMSAVLGTVAVLGLVATPAGATQGGHRYWETNGDVRAARYACYDEAASRHHVPRDRAAYVTWWNSNPPQRAAWSRDFRACRAAHTGQFPRDFHQVSRANFYG